MKIITSLAVFAALIATLHAQLIPTVPPAEKPREQQFAEHVIDTVNAEILRRVAVHRELFNSVWNNGSQGPTAAEVLGAMGTKAALIFAFANENLSHIDRCAKLVGKTRADFLSDEAITPPLAFTVNNDGTVTVNQSP